MLEKIRLLLFRRALRQALAAQKRLRKTHTIQSARNIAVLFDATDEKRRREVLDTVHRLEKHGKKIQLLGFFNTPKPVADAGFPTFCRKDLNWSGIPQSEPVQTFIHAKPDLLLYLNSGQTRPLEWIAALSAAGMKIGMASSEVHDLDIVLETPAEKGILYFMDQLDLYLNKIILTKNESAKAV